METFWAHQNSKKSKSFINQLWNHPKKYTKSDPSLNLKLKIFIKVRPIKLEIVGQMFLTWTWNHWALNFLNIP
jgi:hypothetical protein